jgi:uncharacterized membrane protein
MEMPPTPQDHPAATVIGGVIEHVGAWVEAGGVLIIILGVVAATGLYLWNLTRADQATAYELYRKGLARSILLGLELLVAGDIIRTVVVAPTLNNLLILAGIVLIRTFLSFSLEMEVTGRWPWQRGDVKESPTRPREI